MKTNKIKNILLIIFLFVNITVSFSQGETDPWQGQAPPPAFEEDTADNTPVLPIDEKLCLLIFSGIILGAYITNKHKIIKSKNA
ncbi:hypothetical protein GCM10022389_29380 [Flavobacterium cheonanense]|uniref:Uncharacterized protein n=1 Tax=Flavobacterium cheonanense TaxID=706183 RepID=A0ABP7W597_9FLAO